MPCTKWAFATRGENSLSILVYNHDKLGQRTIKVRNLPFTGANVQVEKYVVDGSHANAFALWKRLKRPAKLPTPAFSEGTLGKTVNAKDLKGEGWKTEGAAYRAGSPAGANDNVLVTTTPGSDVEWQVEAPKDGKYFLWIKADGTYYGGVADVAMDGKVIGQVDAFIDGLDMRWFAFPAQDLKAGQHAIKVRFTDAVSPKLGWAHPRRMLAMDTLALTDDAAFAPKPLGGGAEAQGGVNLKEAGSLKAQTTPIPGDKEISVPLELRDHSVTLLRLTPAR